MSDVLKSEEGKQLIVVALLVSLIGGGGGGFLSNAIRDPRPDPFTGSEGNVLEQRISVLERDHNHFRQELSELPPDWFEDDFREMKAELKALHRTNEDLRIEVLKLSHMLSSLQVRGHFSPNDLISPGIIPGKHKRKE